MKGLRTTIYKVDDLNKAKAWYSDAFNASPYFDEPFYIGFNIGGFELGLMPEDSSPASKTDNILSYWGVDDIEATYKHLLSLGGTEHEAPHNVGGPIMVATVKDPWYNVLGIIFNPTFEA